MRVLDFGKIGVYIGVLHVLTLVALAESNSQVGNIEAAQNVTDIPQFWKEACNFLEEPLEGKEGLANKDYRLRGLAIAFRHGERSSIIQDDDPVGCLPFGKEHVESFDNYTKAVQDFDFRIFMEIYMFKQFPKVPERSLCRAGQLTAEGALQMVKMGKFLQERYAESFLVTGNDWLNVTAISTNFNRTFQSYVAFSSSFFAEKMDDLFKVYLIPSNDVSTCISPDCACAGIANLEAESRKERSKEYLESGPKDIISEAENVRTSLPFSNLNEGDPYSIVDTALGHYICRHRPLPCNGSSCVTYKFLTQITDYFTKRNKEMFLDGAKYPATHKLELVRAYGLLFGVRETITWSREEPKFNFMRILSGHDTSLAPMLHVLGIDFIDPPNYASRVVFEIYDKEESPEILYLRMLNNGEDVTKKIRACTSFTDGMCLASQLEEYARTTILEQLGVKSLDEICKV